MLNNNFQKYLVQTKELFGNLLLVDQNASNEFIKYGNINSKIVFIKNSSSNIEEKIIFRNMLKALGLSIDQVFIIDLINCHTLRKSQINSILQETQLDTVVILGLDIVQSILETNCDLDSLRINDYTIFGKKLIPTYSLKDMMIDKKFKKYVWNDLKVII